MIHHYYSVNDTQDPYRSLIPRSRWDLLAVIIYGLSVGIKTVSFFGSVLLIPIPQLTVIISSTTSTAYILRFHMRCSTCKMEHKFDLLWRFYYVQDTILKVHFHVDRIIIFIHLRQMNTMYYISQLIRFESTFFDRKGKLFSFP